MFGKICYSPGKQLMSRIMKNIYFFKREKFNSELHKKESYNKNLKDGEVFWHVYHKLETSGSLMY